MKQNRIIELLYNIFSEDAIRIAAVGEQLEDAEYCTEHKMCHLNGGNEKAKWEKAMAEAETLAETIEKTDSTYTVENMKKFQLEVNKFLGNNPKAKLLDGLSETERFAVRRFYYHNCY